MDRTAGSPFDARQWGVDGNGDVNQRGSLQAMLDETVARGDASIVLPPGRIAVDSPDNAPVLRLSGGGRIEVAGTPGADGNPATVLVRRWHGDFNDKELPPLIDIRNIGDFLIRDLAIDADPYFYSAGEVISESPLRVRVLAGHPSADTMCARHIGISEPRTHRLIAGKIDWGRRIYLRRAGNDPRILEAFGGELDRQARRGEILFWFFAFGGGSCINIDGARDVYAENIAFRCTNGFVFHTRNIRNLMLRHLDFSPPSGRTASHPRDLVHASEITGDVLIEQCVFGGSSDDAINLHSYYLRVAIRQDDRSIIMRPVHLNNMHTKHPTGWPLKLIDGGAVEFLRYDRTIGISSTIERWWIECGFIMWQTSVFAGALQSGSAAAMHGCRNVRIHFIMHVAPGLYNRRNFITLIVPGMVSSPAST
jgi:hypothetical protein